MGYIEWKHENTVQAVFTGLKYKWIKCAICVYSWSDYNRTMFAWCNIGEKTTNFSVDTALTSLSTYRNNLIS